MQSMGELVELAAGVIPLVIEIDMQSAGTAAMVTCAPYPGTPRSNGRRPDLVYP
jgi:hypothetical protein